MPASRSGDQGEDEKGEAGEDGPPAAPEGSAETAGEQRSGVDRKLDASLAEFDGMLLREKEMLAKQRDESMSASGGSSGGASGGGASGAGASGGGEAGESGAARDGEAGESSDGDSSNTSGDSPNAPTGSHRAEGAPADRDPSEEEDSSRVPKDIPSGNNDDIVARQLREAAMNEEDPALREKLWDEYRKYKGIKK